MHFLTAYSKPLVLILKVLAVIFYFRLGTVLMSSMNTAISPLKEKLFLRYFSSLSIQLFIQVSVSLTIAKIVIYLVATLHISL